MIGQLIGSLTGLATSIIDGKTQIKLTEAEIKKKQLTGEIDWDIEAIKATENSWKDEWITLLFSIPLISSLERSNNVVKMPQLSELDKQFITLEKQRELIREQAKLIEEKRNGV